MPNYNGVADIIQSIPSSHITQSSILEEATGFLNHEDFFPRSGSEITGEDLKRYNVTEIPCLIEGLLQQTGLACLAGSSDTGKSSILRQLAIAIVTGQEYFLGFKINARHRSVIYVSTEDLERETAYLLSRQTRNYSPDAVRGLRFVFDTNSLFTELDIRLANKPADLVVIDCFADAFGGDLKDTQKIRAYLHPFQELAQKHQCVFLYLHHTGKRTEHAEPSKNNLLSGQGFEAKMRLVIELRADPSVPRYRHLCIVKGNYLPSSAKKESHVLDFDELNFLFTNTGTRTPFELLIRHVDGENSKAKYDQAVELINMGHTYEQVAEKMGYGSKGTISKLMEKGKKNGWDKLVSNGNDGNTMETSQ